MLLGEIKRIFHNELDPLYGKEEVGSFFYLLIEHYFDLERFVLALEPDFMLSKEEEVPLFEALGRLKLQQPIQYIIGEVHFMEMCFAVNENVLIPRPETEELVRGILDEISDTRAELTLLDVGTGSGCIAIALAKNLARASVYALDISEKALAVAKENAVRNEVEVTFIEADILALESLNVKFDIIVSNPPYVRDLEKAKMRPNVLEHEPNSALFVPDDNPLLFYDSIASFATHNLKVPGSLHFEINQYLGKETKQLLIDHNFSEIELRNDIFGNDRFLKAKLN